VQTPKEPMADTSAFCVTDCVFSDPRKVTEESMKTMLVMCVVLLAVAATPLAQKPKYGVTVTTEKGVDYAKFKSYSWTRGQPALNKNVDATIVAAVDREMKALGLMKASTGAGDVLATYYSLSRTDIDPTTKGDDKGNPSQYQVGSLTVALLDPADRRSLLRLRIDTPIGSDRTALDSAIDAAVTEMFASYPTRTRK
jgi:hypothetical protein